MESTAAPVLEWQDSYSLGHDRFDKAHKQLLEKANLAVESIHNKYPAKTVIAALSDLLHFACDHFAVEEAILSKSQYPKLVSHRAEHNVRIRELVRFTNEYRPETTDAKRARVFLHDWVLDHLLRSDAEYVPHLRGAGF